MPVDLSVSVLNSNLCAVLPAADVPSMLPAATVLPLQQLQPTAADHRCASEQSFCDQINWSLDQFVIRPNDQLFQVPGQSCSSSCSNACFNQCQTPSCVNTCQNSCYSVSHWIVMSTIIEPLSGHITNLIRTISPTLSEPYPLITAGLRNHHLCPDRCCCAG